MILSSARLAVAFWLVIPVAGFSQDDPVEKTPEIKASQIELAIQRSLKLLERTSAQTADSRSCFNCHGQALPVFALVEARNHGFQVDLKNLQRQLNHTHEHLRQGRENYLEGKGQGGQVDTAGYAAWTLKAGEWPGDDVTSAVVEYLLKYQSDQDHWSSSSNRPPSEVSEFSATYVALIALAQYGTSEQQTRIDERKSQVKQWLLSAAARDTEDQVFRLQSLPYIDVGQNLIREKATELIAQQREDGGWAQTAEMASDAYATSTVLGALHQTSSLDVDDPVYQRGIRYLIDKQKEDGSWHVVTRSKPFQEYFESGFPHGVDQFISTTATGWAVIALLPAVGMIKQGN
jgi:N-acyl-D-amino-acid deacylase